MGAVLYLAMTAFGLLFNGWVLSVLWEWFVTPFGVRDIGVLWACGLVLLAATVIPGSKASDVMKESDGETIMNYVFGTFLVPLLCLVLGWFVHLFASV